MNKIGLILAGAVIFDLGVVVTSSHAAYDAFLKIDPTVSHPALKIKLDAVNNSAVCTAHGGTVSTAGGAQYCDVPASVAHGGWDTGATAPHSGY
jgi:hypothetical protein